MRNYQNMLFCVGIIFSLSTRCLADEAIKVGVSIPLAGEAAEASQDVRNGIEFASDLLAPGKYQFIYEDDKCSGLGATAAAHKFIDVDKVKYVIGHACSGALLAAAPIYESAKVIVIATGTSATSITNAGNYIFRVVPSDADSAQMLYKFVSSRHKHLGIVSEETEYCLGFSKAFEDENKSGKLKLSFETFPPFTRDFKSLLVRLRGKKVDGLFLNPQTEAVLIPLVKEIRDMKWDVPIYAIYYPAAPSFLNAAGSGADGIIYIDFRDPQYVVTGKGLELYHEYLQKYGALKSVPAYFFLAFNNFVALNAAVQKGGDVKKNLYEMEFESPLGMKFRFDKNGDYESDTRLKVFRVIRGGKPVLLED